MYYEIIRAPDLHLEDILNDVAGLGGGNALSLTLLITLNALRGVQE